MTSSRPYTLQEIEIQGQVLQDAQQTLSTCGAQAAQLLQSAPRILLSGCESALNVAYMLASIFAGTTGRLAMPAPADDVFLYPQTVIGPGTAMVCISRSEQTTETIQAPRTARSQDYRTAALTVYSDSLLAREADVVIVLTGSREQSVTTTGPVAAMVHADTFLVLRVMDEGIRPAETTRIIKACEELLPHPRRLAEDILVEALFSRVAFVGASPHYGLAREAQLRFKKMPLLPSDAYSPVYYRHDYGWSVGRFADATMYLRLQTWSSAGRSIGRSNGGPASHNCADAEELLDELLALLLQLPLFECLIYYTAVRLSYDSDRLNNLTHYAQIGGT